MPSDQITPGITFTQLLQYDRPQAMAWVTGNAANPQLSGLVKFYQTFYDGVLVEAEFFGLPNIEKQKQAAFTLCISISSETAPAIFPKQGNIIIPKITSIPPTPAIYCRFSEIRGMLGPLFTISALLLMRLLANQ